MIEFFTSSTFKTVLAALNSGFLKTLQLFFITLIGALPLGLIISFGSMNRWTPLSRPTRWVLLRRGHRDGHDIPAVDVENLDVAGGEQWKKRRWEQAHPGGPAYEPRPMGPAAARAVGFLFAFRPISAVCRLVVWVIRGTPLVLQIIALFYVPGLILEDGSPWPRGEVGRMAAVCVAFIINYAFYFSEIYRGGIQGVPKGQQEAGQVLGMTKAQIFRHITLLQMIKRIVPPISNEIITLVKDTSLARVIALQEVIWMGESFMKGNSGIAGLVWPLFFTAVYYLIFSGIVTVLLGKLEKKLDFFQ